MFSLKFKRCLQKLEHANKDLKDAQEKIKELENKLKKPQDKKDEKNRPWWNKR